MISAAAGQTVDAGHANVKQRHVDEVFASELDGAGTVVRLGHDLDVVDDLAPSLTTDAQASSGHDAASAQASVPAINGPHADSHPTANMRRSNWLPGT